MNVNPLRARPRDVAPARAFPSRLFSASRRRATARSLLACAVAGTAAVSARATEYWVGADGNWDDLMWSATAGGPPGLPPPRDNALIVFGDALTRTVTFSDSSYSLTSIQLDNTGGGNSVLAQAQGTMTVNSLLVGVTGRGEYDMGNGAVLSTGSTGSLTVNWGSFNEGGGSVTAKSITVGGKSASAGAASYSLSNGASLTLTGGMTVGATGTASFTQFGGTGSMGGFNIGSRGTFTLNGGNFSATSTTAGSLVPGGTLALNGGGLSIASGLTLTNATVNQAGGSLSAKTLTFNGTNGGTYTMTGGSLTVTSGSSTPNLSPNAFNSGSFVQSGGTATFGSLTLGLGTFNSGTQASSYSIGTGATLVVTQALGVGAAGGANAASMSQTGGSIQAGSLTIGNSGGQQASYSIGGGTLNVGGDFLLDSGSFTQTGGSIVANRFSRDPSNFSGTENITISGGSLVATGSTIPTDLFAGTVDHTGGTLHVRTLSLGDDSALPPITFYNLSGTGALVVDGDFVAGTSGFTQSGGSTTIGGNLRTNDLLPYLAVNGGTFNVGGTMTLLSSRNATAPTFTQTAGDVTAATLVMGKTGGDGASYALSGGTFTATNGTSAIGITGGLPATFTQTGGIFTASALSVAGAAGSGPNAQVSTYSLSNGSLQVAGDLEVGFDHGGGSYAQSGGTATLGGRLLIDEPSQVPASGTLSGGTLSAAALINNGSFTYSGGTLNAPVVNQGSNTPFGPVTITVTGSGTRTFSTLQNDARAVVDHTTVQFTGNVTNTAAYVSTGSDNHFVTLTNGPAAYLQGGSGDRFRLTGDLLSSSTNSANWQTTASALEFQPGTTSSHVMSVTGVDLGGTTSAGYANNFAWGTLQLDDGQSLGLQDGNAAPGGALYVGEVSLADGLDQIQHITGNGLNIYYDATDPANGYLGGQTFPLVNGGFLIGDAAGAGSVPEPGALGGMLIVGATAGLRRRRRRCGA